MMSQVRVLSGVPHKEKAFEHYLYKEMVSEAFCDYQEVFTAGIVTFLLVLREHFSALSRFRFRESHR